MTTVQLPVAGEERTRALILQTLGARGLVSTERLAKDLGLELETVRRECTWLWEHQKVGRVTKPVESWHVIVPGKPLHVIRELEEKDAPEGAKVPQGPREPGPGSIVFSGTSVRSEMSGMPTASSPPRPEPSSMGTKAKHEEAATA